MKWLNNLLNKIRCGNGYYTCRTSKKDTTQIDKLSEIIKENKKEQIDFAGQKVDKELFENWFYKNGARPEILIHGEPYMPILESDPDEYGMHSIWAWYPKHLVLKWITNK